MSRGNWCLTRRQFIKGSLILMTAPAALIPSSGVRSAGMDQAGVPELAISEGGDPFAITAPHYSRHNDEDRHYTHTDRNLALARHISILDN